MKLTKKSLLLVCSLVLALSLTVMGTIAYLTDTQAVKNSFTTGKVDITVDETIVDEDGQPTTDDEDGDGDPDNDRAEEGNEYHLVPGKEYTKDPTMTIKAGSEPSYVRFHVVITDFTDLMEAFDNHEEYANGFIPGDHVTGYDEDIWRYNEDGYKYDAEANTLTLEFRYFETVDASEAAEDIVLPALFTSFTAPKFFDNADMETLDALEIHVIGEAIQAEGFNDDVDAAWAAFKDHDPITTQTTTTDDADDTDDTAGAEG